MDEVVVVTGAGPDPTGLVSLFVGGSGSGGRGGERTCSSAIGKLSKFHKNLEEYVFTDIK